MHADTQARGVGQKSPTASSLDRRPPHAQVFFQPRDFSGAYGQRFRMPTNRNRSKLLNLFCFFRASYKGEVAVENFHVLFSLKARA